MAPDAGGMAALFNLGHLTFLTLFNFIYRQRLSDPFSMFKVFRCEYQKRSRRFGGVLVSVPV